MQLDNDIYLRIIILFIFLIVVENIVDKQKPHNNDKLERFSSDTKFNCYRSLMCLFFSLYSLENTVNNLVGGYIEPFDYKYDGFNDISKWFMTYLTVDIGKMIWMKNKRWDLYIHHLWCFISFGIAFWYDKIGFFHSSLLINESISIVSGMDAIYMEENQLDKSKKCKLYRKNIIKYLRLPLWIITLLISLRSSHNVPDIMFYNGLVTSCLMIWLDRYWERKCDKVLEK